MAGEQPAAVTRLVRRILNSGRKAEGSTMSGGTADDRAVRATGWAGLDGGGRQATAALDGIADKDDRDLIEGDLATLPWLDDPPPHSGLRRIRSEARPCPTSSSGSCSGARPPPGRDARRGETGRSPRATRTSGRGTTCTRSSATRTSRSSRAGRCSTPGRARPSGPRLGLLVGANTFRNPGLVAKTAATLDHISDGRAILGIGGAWMELEHQAHGIEFGSGPASASTGSMNRSARSGGCSTASRSPPEPGGHYAFDDLRHVPAPGPEARCRS